jgi:hypothetical protein
MGFWEKVKEDVQKSFSEGMAVIKKQTGRLTEEGKKKFKLFELKNKVHQHMADLGALVYKLGAGAKKPLEDPKVNALIDKIKKFEDQIRKLEATGKKKAAPKKTVKKTAKKATRKTVKKKTAGVEKEQQ